MSLGPHLTTSCKEVKHRHTFHYKKFGTMEIFAKSMGNKQSSVLVNYKGHIFINGIEVRLSRDRRVVRSLNRSPMPISLQSFYETAVEFRKWVSPERVTLSKGLWRKSPLRRVMKDVRGLLRTISKHSYRDYYFDLKDGNANKECQLKYIRNEKERLMSLLNALNESSRRSIRHYKRLRKKLHQNDESIVLLKRALDTLCEGVIRKNLKDKSAANIEEKFNSLVSKDKMNIDIMYEMERSLNQLKNDLDEKNKQLAAKDKVILEQEKLIRNLQSLNQRHDKQLKENGIMGGPENDSRKLEQRQTGGTNTQMNGTKESENNLFKYVVGNGHNVSHQGDDCDKASHDSCVETSQHEHLEIKDPDVSNINNDLGAHMVGEGNSVTSQMKANCKKLSSIQRQQRAESKSSLSPSSLAISDDTAVRSPGLISLLENQRVTPSERHNISVCENVKCTGNCRRKVVILARKTRTYRELLAKVTAERDMLEKQKTYLADMVRAAVKDREAMTSQLIEVAGHRRHASNGINDTISSNNVNSCKYLESRLRYLLEINGELQDKIMAKRRAMAT